MITQAEIDSEIAKLKELICILARRGYILKSELLGLLPACRATHMTIDGLEDIMYSLIDEDVEYKDDVISTDTYRACADVQDKINKYGYKNLFDLLNLQNNASIQLVEETVRSHMLWADQNRRTLLEIILGIIVAKELLEAYCNFIEMEGIFRELDLRREFGIEKISQEEISEYAAELEREKGVPRERAQELLHQGAQEKGLRVENDTRALQKENEKSLDTQNEQEKEEDREQEKAQELDEFLIPIRDIDKERANEKNRGYTIGR